MHPWPYHGEGSKVAQSISQSVSEEALNITPGKYMEGGLGKKAACRDGSHTTKRSPNDKDSIKCLCTYDGEGCDEGHCYSNPWLDKGKGLVGQNIELKSMFAYDSDALPREMGKFLSDKLPWSNTPRAIPDTWLTRFGNTECWYMDPVEIAAHRYERVGWFEKASKLRAKFRGLSILHWWVIQWYKWAENQQSPQVTDYHKVGTSATCTSITKLPKYSGWTSTNQKGSNDLEDLFDEEFLSEVFDYTLVLHLTILLADGTKVPPIGTNTSKAVENSHKTKAMNNFSISNPAHKRFSVDISSSGLSPKPRMLLDTERIIPQQLKHEIFRNCYSVDLRSHADGHAEGGRNSIDESIVYRNHARWVLENDVMSCDSEDGEDVSLMATHPISHDISQGNPSKGSKGLPTQLAGCPLAESHWNDMFFLGDSDTSGYFDSDSSISSGDDHFPTISGEELEKVLEEAKGTVQFHKWQNAPPGEHQKEFKTLINLHRYARESEARNQARWRSRERAEKKGETMAISVPNENNFCGRPNLVSSFSRGGLKLPSSPVSGKAFTKFNRDQPITTVSEKKTPRILGPESQLATKETEYHYITVDDIKFLRNLKRQFGGSEFVPQTQDRTDIALSSEVTLNKDLGKGSQKHIPLRVITSGPGKSLRDMLRTAKPFPGISHCTKYGNWFPRGQFGERTDNHSESSQINPDGLILKRHHLTAPLGDVTFRLGSVDHHPFSSAVKSSTFKKLVISTGRLCNLGANISLSGFWATENLFITTLNFHPWAPSTTTESLQDQIEDFQLRKNEIDVFVTNNNNTNWLGLNDDPEAIKVILRAWDTTARIAIFQPEDKNKVSKNFVGIDMLIEENAVYGYNGVHVATVGYNPLDTVRDDLVGLGLLALGHRSVTFGELTVFEGCRRDMAQLPQVFTRLDSGVSHGSYGRMCIIMEVTKNSGSIVGIVSGQCEERGLYRPEAFSDFVSTFPDGFKDELRRVLKS